MSVLSLKGQLSKVAEQGKAVSKTDLRKSMAENRVPPQKRTERDDGCAEGDDQQPGAVPLSDAKNDEGVPMPYHEGVDEAMLEWFQENGLIFYWESFVDEGFDMEGIRALDDSADDKHTIRDLIHVEDDFVKFWDSQKHLRPSPVQSSESSFQERKHEYGDDDSSDSNSSSGVKEGVQDVSQPEPELQSEPPVEAEPELQDEPVAMPEAEPVAVPEAVQQPTSVAKPEAKPEPQIEAASPSQSTTPQEAESHSDSSPSDDDESIGSTPYEMPPVDPTKPRDSNDMNDGTTAKHDDSDDSDESDDEEDGNESADDESKPKTIEDEKQHEVEDPKEVEKQKKVMEQVAPEQKHQVEQKEAVAPPQPQPQQQPQPQPPAKRSRVVTKEMMCATFIVLLIAYFYPGSGPICATPDIAFSNSVENCNTTKTGETCVFDCLPGFHVFSKLHRKHVRQYSLTCGKDGTWEESPLPTCKREFILPPLDFTRKIAQNDVKSLEFPSEITTVDGVKLRQIHYKVTMQSTDAKDVWFDKECQCFMKGKDAGEGSIPFSLVGRARGGMVFEADGSVMYSNLAPPVDVSGKKDWFRPDKSLVAKVILEWKSTSTNSNFCITSRPERVNFCGDKFEKELIAGSQYRYTAKVDVDGSGLDLNRDHKYILCVEDFAGNKGCDDTEVAPFF